MKDKARIFLCHSCSDKPIVREVATALQQSGIAVWIDEVELHVGDSLIERIGRALHESDFVLAFLSSASVDSNWVQKELSLSMAREVASRRVTVLPVLLDDCPIPFYLRDKLYADLRETARKDSEVGHIIRAIRHHMNSETPAVEHEKAKVKQEPMAWGDVDRGKVVHDRGEEYLG